MRTSTYFGDYCVNQALWRVSYSQRMNMSLFARLTDELSKKMENYAAAEAVRLHKSSRGKLRLIGVAIGILVVILLALWMEYHP